MFNKTIAQTIKIKDDQLIQQKIYTYIPQALQTFHTESLAEQIVEQILQPVSTANTQLVIELHTQARPTAIKLAQAYNPGPLSPADIDTLCQNLRTLLKVQEPNIDSGHLKSVVERRDTRHAIGTATSPLTINPTELILAIARHYAQHIYNTPKPNTPAEEAAYQRLLQIGMLLQTQCLPMTAKTISEVMRGQVQSFPVLPKYVAPETIALPLFINRTNYVSGTLSVPCRYIQQFGILGDAVNELTYRYLNHQSIFTPAIANPTGLLALRQSIIEPVDGYLTAVTGVALLERLLRAIANDLTTKKILNLAICQADPVLQQALEPIFCKDELGIRDGLAHGLHGIGQNPKVFNFMLGQIMNAFLVLSKKYPASPVSAMPTSISTTDIAFAENFLVQNNVLKLISSPQTFMSTVTARYQQLAPEKILLGQGLFYLYFSLQRSSKSGQPVSPTEVLVNTLAALIFFEELLRAKATANGIRTLIVAGPKNNKLFPEYKMLDTTSQGLLDPALVPQLLGTLSPNETTALDILRRFRDALLHGEIYDITELFCAAHLAIYFTVKLI